MLCNFLGNDNGSGTTGSVFGSSIGSSTFGNSDSNIAVQLGGTSQREYYRNHTVKNLMNKIGGETLNIAFSQTLDFTGLLLPLLEVKVLGGQFLKRDPMPMEGPRLILE